MQVVELFDLRFHPLGTLRHPITLSFVDHGQGIVRVSPNKIVRSIALDAALHKLCSLSGHRPTHWNLYIFLDDSVHQDLLCWAALNAINPSLVRQSFQFLLRLLFHLVDSLFIVVDDDLVVKQVFALQNAVAELDDELQVLHHLGELEQVLGLDHFADVHGIRLEALQALQDVEDLVLLRPDLVVDLALVSVDLLADARDAQLAAVLDLALGARLASPVGSLDRHGHLVEVDCGTAITLNLATTAAD